MNLRGPRLALAVLMASVAAGCTTPQTTSETGESAPRLATDAPLGSRIRKPSTTAPVTGLTREEVENAKVMQRVQHTGAAQRTPN